MRPARMIQRLVVVALVALGVAGGGATASAYPLTWMSATDITAGRLMSALTITPDGHYLYLAQAGTPCRLYKVDISGETPVAVRDFTLDARLGGYPPALMLSSDGAYLYLATDAGLVKLNAADVTYINPANPIDPSGFYDKTMADSQYSRASVLSPDGQYAYFVDADGPSSNEANAVNQGFKIRLSDMSFVAQHDLPAYGGLAISSDGNVLFAIDGQNAVTGTGHSALQQFSTADFSTIGSAITTGIDYLGQSVVSADGYMYSATSDPNGVNYGADVQIAKFDLGEFEQVGASAGITISGAPVGAQTAIALSPDGSRLFVANGSEPSKLVEYQTSDMSVLGTIDFNPDGSEGLDFMAAGASPEGAFLYLSAGNSPAMPLVKLQYAALYDLDVVKAGSGAGTVTSDVGGIDCGTTCSASIVESTASVVLTAAPASGSTFAGWSGACSGADTTCTVTMGAARSVTATFDTASPGPEPEPDGGGRAAVPKRALRHGLTATAGGVVGVPLVCVSNAGACRAAGTVTATLPSSLRATFTKVIGRFAGVTIRAGKRKTVTIRLDAATYAKLQALGVARVRIAIRVRSTVGGATTTTTSRTWLRITPASPTPVTG